MASRYCYRIQDWYCSLCFAPAGISPHVLIINQLQHEPFVSTSPNLFIYTNGRKAGFLVHSSCLKIVLRAYSEDQGIAQMIPLLCRAASAMCCLWPATQDEIWKRSDRIRRSCFHKAVGTLFNKEIPEETAVMALARRVAQLPMELQDLILVLANPSSLLQVCTLLTFTRELPMFTETSAQPMSSTREFLGESFLITPRRGLAGQTFVLTFNQQHCLSMEHLTPSGTSTGKPGYWYRYLTYPADDRRTYAKVQTLGTTFACTVAPFLDFQETVDPLCLWNEITPDAVSNYTWLTDPFSSPREEEARRYVSRMRITNISSKTIGLTVVNSWNLLYALHAHTGGEEDQQFYRRLSKPPNYPVSQAPPLQYDDLVWHYFPLSSDELITHVAMVSQCLALSTLRSKPHTSQRRTKVFAPELDRAEPHFLRESSLNGSGYVTSISVGVREGLFRLSRPRVAVSFKKANLPQHKHPPLCWVAPSVPYPLHHIYRSRVDVSRYTSFQACLQTDCEPAECIGLLFRSRDNCEVLGQWRWDLRVTDEIDLPTSIVLANNVTSTETAAITLWKEACPNDIHESDRINIEGMLEWRTKRAWAYVGQIHE